MALSQLRIPPFDKCNYFFIYLIPRVLGSENSHHYGSHIKMLVDDRDVEFCANYLSCLSGNVVSRLND